MNNPDDNQSLLKLITAITVGSYAAALVAAASAVFASYHHPLLASLLLLASFVLALGAEGCKRLHRDISNGVGVDKKDGDDDPEGGEMA